MSLYEKGGRKLNSREYRAAKKGQSWEFKLMFQITKAMEKSSSKKDFLLLMSDLDTKYIGQKTGSTSPSPVPTGRNAGANCNVKLLSIIPCVWWRAYFYYADYCYCVPKTDSKNERRCSIPELRR